MELGRATEPKLARRKPEPFARADGFGAAEQRAGIELANRTSTRRHELTNDALEADVHDPRRFYLPLGQDAGLRLGADAANHDLPWSIDDARAPAVERVHRDGAFEMLLDDARSLDRYVEWPGLPRRS